MSTTTLDLTSPPAAPRKLVRKGAGKARFFMGTANQLDPLRGCPGAMVPEGHLSRAVLQMVEKLDVSVLEEQYSSLGRRGLHPRRKLAVLLYASLVGVHEASAIERAAKTDLAYQLLSDGHSISATMMRTFRRENAEFLMSAIEQTVDLAARAKLIDPKDLAVDSMRLQADASTKSIRTLNRSEERLAELAKVDLTQLDEGQRQAHEDKVAKHEEAARRCTEEGRTSLSVTTPSAALLKFPSGAALPGHRVSVVAAGVKLRFVIAVVIGSAPTDHNLLPPLANEARRILEKAGMQGPFQMAGDAGFLGQDDLAFAKEHREQMDVLINDPPQPRRGKSRRKGGFFSKAEFDFRADGSVACPAKRPMHGPVKAGAGKVRYRGVGCDSCPLHDQCTSVAVREVIVDPERDRLHRSMHERMAEEGAEERYRRRIATVEPVFSHIEDVMRYRRASSRNTDSVRGEILAKILAYNLLRLFFCPSRRVAFVEATFDGRRIKTTKVQVLDAAEAVAAWSRDRSRPCFS